MVNLDDVISFGTSVPEALARLEEVLSRLSDFGLQLRAKKCTFMQTEVAFLGHIVGRTGASGGTDVEGVPPRLDRPTTGGV